MNEGQRDASGLIAAGLSAMRAGSGVLREADVALAVKPTPASNARWFVRMFVLPRRTKDSVKPVELFWSSLEQARDQFESCDAMLSRAFSIHGDIPAVAALQAELGAAGYEHIRPALHAHVVSGAEADGSQLLQPTVARMRLCEARMLAAIQALAAAE